MGPVRTTGNRKCICGNDCEYTALTLDGVEHIIWHECGRVIVNLTAGMSLEIPEIVFTEKIITD